MQRFTKVTTKFVLYGVVAVTAAAISFLMGASQSTDGVSMLGSVPTAFADATSGSTTGSDTGSASGSTDGGGDGGGAGGGSSCAGSCCCGSY